MKPSLVLLSGGLPAEAWLSRRTAAHLGTLLGERGFSCLRLDWDGRDRVDEYLAGDDAPRASHAGLAAALERHRARLVVNCLHGAWECGGRVQGLLELLGMRYTGAPLQAAVMGMDKMLCKLLARSLEIPLPACACPRPGEIMAEKAFLKGLGPPLVLKPLRGGSSEDLHLLRAQEDLRRPCPAGSFLEDFLPGREYCAAVFTPAPGEKPLLLPAARIDYAGEVFSARHKEEGDYVVQRATDLPREKADRMRHQAWLMHRALGMAGFSRCDFRLNEHGMPVFLEINVQPGLAPGSIVPRILAFSGREDWLADLLERHIQHVQAP